MKPYKDKRFSIAVLDYGEYSYRENLSTITPNELRSFLAKHEIFDVQDMPLKEIARLEEEIEELKSDLKWALHQIEHFRINTDEDTKMAWL